MFRDELSAIDDHAFAVSNAAGDMLPGVAHGFFYADTRFLSALTLRINGREPVPLTSGNLGHNVVSIYATNPRMDDLPASSITLVRDRFVCGGVHEDITLANHLDEEVRLELTIDFAADFADIFEVRTGDIVKIGKTAVEPTEGVDLAFVYRRQDYVRRTHITFSQTPVIDGQRAVFAITLGPKERWQTCLTVQPVAGDKPIEVPCPKQELGPALAAQSPATEVTVPRRGSNGFITRWLATAPRLRTADSVLSRAYQRAVKDLIALALEMEGGNLVPAAGLPWYMAMFGRDSLITGLQTQILGSELSVGVLKALASYQGRRRDDFRDEQPGKIPHEVRSGELASMEDVPHSRYYGTVDATPLYLILLSETYRWTGDLELVRQLLPVAEAALNWIDKYGDMDGDGFVEYKRRTPHGLVNQGWKDSEDSMRFEDGRFAETPIALVEVQGYVYDAKVRMAEIYRALGKTQKTKALEQAARELKERFNEAFWMPDKGFYALGLDAEKRQIDSITSNPGHCLWSGIIDAERAGAVVERLLAPDMFSGWGIRTMSSYMRAYSPISYHNGSVWPHDNSIIAAGMARYGFGAQAAQVARAILEAASYFPDYRLPELFAGYPRREASFPVEYPSASSPQAWAAGAVIHLLQTLYGIAPVDGRLAGNALPAVEELRIEGVLYRGERYDLLLPG